MPFSAIAAQRNKALSIYALEDYAEIKHVMVSLG